MTGRAFLVPSMIEAIHVCCPGPSLAARLRHAWRDADFVVAVNAAAQVIPADAWVAIDNEAFTRFTPMGNPLRVSMESMRDRLCRLCPERRDEWNSVRWASLTDCAFPTAPKNAGTHFCYSGLGALVYALTVARMVGLEEVTVHGCDMSGTGDCVGHPPTMDEVHRLAVERSRSDDRWEREARGLRHILRVAKDRGMTVRFTTAPRALEVFGEVAA